MSARIFVTQPVAPSALARLAPVATIRVNRDPLRILPKRALIAAVRKCEILFCRLHDVVDREVLTANARLRLVASMAVTPEGIDLGVATARGIAVTVVPPMVTEASADVAFGLILAVARRIIEGDRLVRAGRFPGSQSNYLAGASVYGKTLGLVGGGGRIGKAVARRARGFSMRVLYWAPRRKPAAEEQEAGII
jgi:glyoxylate reductase